ncbi:ATP-grasp domain-containing protein [[Ruminococcus] gnavus]|uniref:ATP-grasp domain-containing protein n=1 Tax=Mediterraneibacter gnavus TaxID=33038 RepID=UPI00210B8673|nr:ATP-grasp domain-containing protein [Mediterraneibacter gnavus]MCQ4701350.1 ATP-grasp domain-containing protein [Mediterraneibacter gnavus]
METILVTAIGSFAADIVIKTLKKQGYMVIGCDIYKKEWIADAYNVDEFYQVPLVNKEKEYLEVILKICYERKIKFIFPLTDVEVDFYNRNRDIFEKRGIILCISCEKTIDICRNKMILNQHLENKGICKIIPTYLLDSADIQSLDYPVVIKPFNGRSSQGLYYIDNVGMMESFISQNDVHGYIVQPKIIGSILTVDVVRNEVTKKTVCVARKELLRTLNGAGTSVYVFEDNKLKEQCEKIADELNVNGCVNFEFIETEQGEKYFLECNPRFSGGVEFSCLSGYDCVTNHIRCFIKGEIEDAVQLKNQYIARKYEEYITKIGDE